LAEGFIFILDYANGLAKRTMAIVVLSLFQVVDLELEAFNLLGGEREFVLVFYRFLEEQIIISLELPILLPEQRAFLLQLVVVIGGPFS